VLRWLRWEVGWRPLRLPSYSEDPASGWDNRAVRPRAEALAVVGMLAERGAALSQGPVVAHSGSRVRLARRPAPWPGSG
jgi:hypothetical protein